MLPRTAPSRPSLRFQLLTLLMGGVALSLVISMANSLLLAWDLQKSQVTRTLETTARSVSIAASAAVAFNDEKAASDALSILGPQQEIEGAAVYALDGTRLALFGAPAHVPERVLGMVAHGPDLTPLSRTSTLLMPIELDGSALGYLYVHANLERHRASYMHQALLSALASLLALALALWLGLRFIERTAGPLISLAALARRVRQSEDHGVPPPPPQARAVSLEVDELVHSFHAMLSELQARARALAEYQRELEEKVQARTQALAQTNAALTEEIAIRKQNEALIRANEELLLIQKQSAEDANQAKSRFLAAASHDLRQPMHAIGLLVSALKDRLALVSPPEALDGMPEVQQLMGLINASIENMGVLLGDLLDLSRLEAGVVVPQVACVPLASVFRPLENRLRPLAEEKGLTLRFVATRLAVTTDPSLLERILANLIENAIRYSQRGGVLVGVRRRGKEGLLLQVVDTGAGIPEDMTGRVFEEYVQLANPERDRRKGLGLGLSIVKRLTTLLAIPIRLQSQVGSGTRFSLELRRCEGAGPAPGAEPAQPPEVTDGPRKLVVLIDDDEAILAAARALIQPWHMDLIAESSLEAALAALDAAGQSPDLILSDYRLPGDLDGIGVVEHLRARYGADLPGVLITGDTGEDTLRSITGSGLVALHKPLQPAKLRALLGHLLHP